MGNITRSQRRAYLLRGKQLSYYFSWSLLPVGIFFSYLFFVNHSWKPLVVTMLFFDIPGVFCFVHSHTRFFWPVNIQNKYIKKCMEDDQKLTISAANDQKDDNPVTVTPANKQRKKVNSNNISNLVDSVELTPGQKNAAKFAATYATLKTAQKVTNNFGIDLVSKSNTEKYKQTIRMPGQRPAGNTCFDCEHAVYKDAERITCKADGFNRTWPKYMSSCQKFKPKNAR